MLKNDLLLRALRGEKTERVPVWMMRQAGRYLPDYLKLKAKYDFFTHGLWNDENIGENNGCIHTDLVNWL